MSRRAPKSLGATGRFPQGRIHQSDEGGLQFAIAKDIEHGCVLLDFGTPVKWMGLPPATARQLGEALIQKANELEEEPLPGLPQ